MTEYSAKPKVWLYTHDTDFLYGKSEKMNFFHRDANKDSYGKA